MAISLTIGSPIFGYEDPMTRIAVLADIHGNLPAFEAVLNDLADASVDEIILAGDLVGRGPQGSAVVKRAQSLGLRSVRGNHEDYILSFRRREVPAEWLEAEEWGCSRWMAAELDESDIAFIDSFPFTTSPATADTVKIFHGSPSSYNEGLGPWTDDAKVQKYLVESAGQVLVCGHTHRPAQWHFAAGLAVNVGSVGLPFNADTRAQYAILTSGPDGWSVEPRMVAYDKELVFAAYESSGFLANGGATALLLRHEVATARPFLVPFLKWAEITEQPPITASLAQFFEYFDPELSIVDQFKRLAELQASR